MAQVLSCPAQLLQSWFSIAGAIEQALSSKVGTSGSAVRPRLGTLRFFAQDFAGKPRGDQRRLAPTVSPPTRGLCSDPAEKQQIPLFPDGWKGPASPGIAHGMATWHGAKLWLHRCGKREACGAHPVGTSLRMWEPRLLLELSSGLSSAGGHIRPRHAGSAVQNSGETMLLIRPRRWQRSLERGAGSGPEMARRGGDVCKPATCCSAVPVKINESVVSQQGRKDLETCARTGFGDANPPEGPIKHISIWAVGFFQARDYFLIENSLACPLWLDTRRGLPTGTDCDSPEERRELPRSSLPSLNLGDHSWGLLPTEAPATGDDGAMKSHQWHPPSVPDRLDIPFPGGEFRPKQGMQQRRKALDPTEHRCLLTWLIPCLESPCTVCD